MNDIAAIMRDQAGDGHVFDHSNDTVVVTRAILKNGAAEIERLRARERKIIDETWGEALEDGSVPSTKLQDKIIAAVDNQQSPSGSKE